MLSGENLLLVGRDDSGHPTRDCIPKVSAVAPRALPLAVESKYGTHNTVKVWF